MAPLRVVHLSVMRSLSGGQRKQLIQVGERCVILGPTAAAHVVDQQSQPRMTFRNPCDDIEMPACQQPDRQAGASAAGHSQSTVPSVHQLCWCG